MKQMRQNTCEMSRVKDCPPDNVRVDTPWSSELDKGFALSKICIIVRKLMTEHEFRYMETTGGKSAREVVMKT